MLFRSADTNNSSKLFGPGWYAKAQAEAEARKSEFEKSEVVIDSTGTGKKRRRF